MQFSNRTPLNQFMIDSTIAFYWKTIRRLGPARFAEEVGRKLAGEFRYRRFVSFAANAPDDYSAHFALKRMGISDPGRVAEDIRNRRFPLFFLEPAQQDVYRNCLENRGALQNILKEADRIAQGTCSVFGHEIRWDTEDFDWHTDPLSGRRWDKKARLYLREKMDGEVVVPAPGDVRVVWEISRLGCLVRLGQAWRLTGDEKYARTLAAILDNWMEHNCPYRGVNWSSAMEAAIRAVNVIWAFFLVIDSPALTDKMVGKILSFLALSREFILGSMERYFEASGNHYIANLTGLIYIDLLFPNLSRSSRVGFAVRELAGEAEKQVYPDGVHFESSTAYHGFVLEMFLSAAVLCQKNGRKIPKRFLDTIAKMAVFTKEALLPSSRTAQIGDNDSGRLVELGEGGSLNHSRWCDLAAAFGNTPSLASGKYPAEEILWYLGPESYQTHSTGIPQTRPVVSSAFPDAGLYFMKNSDGWLGIVCGPNGLYDRGAHAHNDKLSFELWYGGEPFLVDPGSCIYTGNPTLRNRFRSTAYHNTVMVDGEEQNRFAEDVFFLHNDTDARVPVWESNDEYDFLSGVHFGYKRLPHPVIHKRDIRFDKKETSWEITDCFEGEGKHCLEWNLHLAPKVEVEIGDAKTFRLKTKNSRLFIRFDEPAGINIEEGRFSPGYRQKRPSKIIRRRITTGLPHQVSLSIRGEKI
jgi:uncharacterized heparinase superfamily protein